MNQRVYRSSVNGDEAGIDARSSVVEAGKFPKEEKFQASSFELRTSIRASPTKNEHRALIKEGKYGKR
ncbi:hypothetical protein AMJ44_14805 [candidate division WOR-1 bacterium DG_54_3]|uniref:Uncharacterized protein n=1 Tax=candidate division WOR-1 bacterium DG_54_3 TaxID=1703775 RepID=A0A0S7XLK2_UNCSA|nr:MAG: hypothetical protein AMJ44_14805 [candidate division WOR-1 bacterium DG_54_3]